MPEDAKWRMRWAKKVLLNVTLPEGLTPKFMSKIEATFPIVELVFKDMCKFKLLPENKMHPTFHVSLV